MTMTMMRRRTVRVDSMAPRVESGFGKLGQEPVDLIRVGGDQGVGRFFFEPVRATKVPLASQG
jgi:hypothetical protein